MTDESRDGGRGQRSTSCGAHDDSSSHPGTGYLWRSRISDPKDQLNAGHHKKSSPCGGNDSRRKDRKGRCLSSSTPSPPSTPAAAARHVASCICELCRRARATRKPRSQLQPTFRVVGIEPALVSKTLEAHGFKREYGKKGPGGSARPGTWRIIWSSQHLRREIGERRDSRVSAARKPS